MRALKYPASILDPPAEDCAGDINGDDMVNVIDLLAVINAWGICDGCNADINEDGSVNVTDLLAIVDSWGVCP